MLAALDVLLLVVEAVDALEVGETPVIMRIPWFIDPFAGS
jgi:hypothetical protein